MAVVQRVGDVACAHRKRGGIQRQRRFQAILLQKRVLHGKSTCTRFAQLVHLVGHHVFAGRCTDLHAGTGARRTRQRRHRRQRTGAIHVVVLVALLDPHRRAQESQLRRALGTIDARKPEPALVQGVFHRDQVDVEAQRVDEAAHQCRRHFILRSLHASGTARRGVTFGFLELLLRVGNSLGPDLKRCRQPIGRAHQRSTARVEPEAADEAAPLRASRDHLQLTQRDAVAGR